MMRRKAKDVFINLSKYTVFFFGIIISVYFESRAFAVGFILSFIVTLFLYGKIKAKKWNLILVALAGSFVLLCAIFFVKTDSSLGRIFIYKISSQIYKHNWLKGIGIGKFKTVYMHYQADYFKKGKFTETELLLADNTYFAFNDYYQFIIETGIVGIFLLSIFFLLIFLLIRRAIFSDRESVILLNAIGIFIAICFAACFTYVFNKLEFQFVFVLCITILSRSFFKRANAFFVKAIPLIGTIVIFILAANTYNFDLRNYYALLSLKKVRQLEQAGYRYEARKLLLDNEKHFYNDDEYLELKSYLLANNMELDKAEVATKLLIKHKPSSMAYARLAYIYKQMNKNDLAEQFYLKAINMVPNRFGVRYSLFLFYRSIGKEDKSLKCANEILKLPVKIPSLTIDQIKLNLIKYKNEEDKIKTIN
ncbi:hypothetical protein EZ456_02170 [Pedobacter psychrodurus]|uniref:O-antigen ligase-related domain-containing protein n=1 Tax=Pedobacter psychrodurus TaxID=2530456 RepID=A0A4R0Q1M2_9SPHI|nr:O-antigen ligase family protein [Pedobacter psychrodurus]TCD28987.1 hypothetical protein EZ456_02170 [Pedobacter psychrodurus]